MEYLNEVKIWLNSPYIDQQTRNELLDAMENHADIADRFYKDLEFGTAGLRGIMGAGRNRMNIYTVGRATQGLANYILSFGDRYRERGVVIAYDTRHGSKLYALRTALVLAGNGIKAYLFDGHRPTPELSYAIRHLGAAAGVVITASHNPPQYNGYKVYWEDGGQITPDRAMDITREINGVKGFEDVKAADRQQAVEKGLFEFIGNDVDQSYIESVMTLCIDRQMVQNNGDRLKVVYTPLHGTGSRPVQTVLNSSGFTNLTVVREQDNDDPDFSTVRSPNPEDIDALQMAIEYAEAIRADIVLGTDPDCDRLGMAVMDESGRFKVLSGNQIGALMTDYLLSRRSALGLSKPGDAIIKSIVTNNMGKRIAEAYGVNTFETLTGFKFIGQKIEEFSRDGGYRFVFGYEESNGFLAGDFVRDKDAVIAALIACQMALYHKMNGRSVLEALKGLSDKYGYYCDSVESIALEGKEGTDRVAAIMQYLRDNTGRINDLFDREVEEIRDYSGKKVLRIREGSSVGTELPESDVLYYMLCDSSWFCIRPSGTEPKIKFYFSAVGRDKSKAKERLEQMRQRLLDEVSHLLEASIR